MSKFGDYLTEMVAADQQDVITIFLVSKFKLNEPWS